MGVNGLWKVIESAGKYICYDDLNGSVAAVDVSVWINMATKGMRNVDGSKVNNGHLLYLFKRICRMLELGIKPIFIFDGKAPILKQKTSRKRREKRSNNQLERDKKYRTLLANRLLTNSIGMKSKKPSDLSNFNEMVSNKLNDPFDIAYKDYLHNITVCNDTFSNNVTIEPTNQSVDSCKESTKIEDIFSENFSQLPLNEQYVLLREARDSFTRNNNNVFDLSCDEKIDLISKFQFQRLIKKAKITQKLNDIEANIRMTSLNDITERSTNLRSYKYQRMNKVLAGNRLASNEHAYYLLLEQEGYIKQSDNKRIEAKKLTSSPENCHLVNNSKMKPMKFKSRKSSLKYTDKCDETQSNIFATELKISEDESSPISSRLLYDDKFTSTCDKLEPNDQSCNMLDNTLPNEIKNVIVQDTKDYNVEKIITDSTDMISDKSKPLNYSGNNNALQTDDTEGGIYSNNNKNESLNESKSNSLSSMEINIPLNEQIDKNNNVSDKSATSLPLYDTSLIIKDINRMERQASSITEQIVSDCISLFDAFGIPWLIAPAEAEAQCAHLNAISKCDFVLTNDGDAILFGAKRILKGFLHYLGDNHSSKSHTKQHLSIKYGSIYDLCDIENKLSFTRMDLIAYALLAGCDYTGGVSHIGPAKAQAIIKQFSVKESALTTLNQFKEAVNSSDSQFNKQFKNISLPDNFPNKTIIDAFITPLVDDCSQLDFVWNGIHRKNLFELCRDKFNWDTLKFDAALFSVEKSIKLRNQHPITQWFPVYKSL